MVKFIHIDGRFQFEGNYWASLVSKSRFVEVWEISKFQTIPEDDEFGLDGCNCSTEFVAIECIKLNLNFLTESSSVVYVKKPFNLTIFILYYGAGYVNTLQLLMVAGYTIYIWTYQYTTVNIAIASPICM
jgi:hypothetical protein